MKIQSLLAAGAVLLAVSMPGQEAKKGIVSPTTRTLPSSMP